MEEIKEKSNQINKNTHEFNEANKRYQLNMENINKDLVETRLK